MSWNKIDPSGNKDYRFYDFLALRKFPYLGFTESIWSIMSSGDSPTPHLNSTAQAFDFGQSEPRTTLLGQSEPKPLPAGTSGGRVSPLPTTSKEVGVQISGKTGGGEIQASVLVEPGGGRDKDKDGDKEEELFGSPTLNNGEEGGDKDKEDDRALPNDRIGNNNEKDKRDKKDDKSRKFNGNLDRLDGVWLKKEQKKPQNNEDEENCIVKCLYVTMTCCECSIM